MESAFPEVDRFSRRTWRRLLKGRSIALIALIEDTVMGASVILLRNGLDIGRLYSLSVAQAARGKGLARRLLREGELAALEQGCRRMRLEVRKSNQAAINLYESAGYRQIGNIEAYYPDGETAVRMEKSLASLAGPD
jgi:ribosomal protein S18 acetylase RimI-like enzyme